MNYLLYFILICVALFFIHKWLSKFKVPKIGSLALITGGVKCGKSTLSVAIALSEFKRRRRKVKFVNFFRKLFGKILIELPLLYSNVPLGVPYVKLTDDLLLRKERFVYGSVIYCQEASLVADSQLLKDKDINNQLLLFNKLIGHETKGGCLIYDTQCISDLHYSIKRCLSEYIYVHHITKWIPGFLILHVIENRYADDGSIVNGGEQDLENNLRKVIIRKKYWKYFDCYCYSKLTDDLPVNKDIIHNDKNSDLKANEILSFRKDFDFKAENNEKECEDEKKDNK